MRRAKTAVREVTSGWLKTLMVAALSLPFFFPLWWLASSAFKPRNELFRYPPTLLPSTWRLENFSEVFTEAPFFRQFVNSLVVAALVVAGIVALSTAAGFVFARARSKLVNGLFLLIISSQMIPYEATIIPLFQMSRIFGWIDTLIPLVVFMIFGPPAAFATFLMRQVFLLFPPELEDAARLDGLSLPGILWFIAIPIARPTMAAVGVIAFLVSWNSFLHPLVFLSSPENYTLPIAILQYTDNIGAPLWHLQLTATFLSVIPMALVFLVAQRSLRETFAGSGIVG